MDSRGWPTRPRAALRPTAETDPWGDAPPPADELPEVDRAISDDERKLMYDTCRKSGMNDAAFRDMVRGYGYASSKDVSFNVYREIMGRMKGAT